MFAIIFFEIKRTNNINVYKKTQIKMKWVLQIFTQKSFLSGEIKIFSWECFKKLLINILTLTNLTDRWVVNICYL